jgi:hypothetical protein
MESTRLNPSFSLRVQNFVRKRYVYPSLDDYVEEEITLCVVAFRVHPKCSKNTDRDTPNPSSVYRPPIMQHS